MDADANVNYALSVANDSYTWYQRAAIRSRRAYRLSEFMVFLISASIPVIATIGRDGSLLTAILGAAIVAISSLRSLFNWYENYLRFSRAREAVEGERRLFRIGAAPYAEPESRSEALVRNVSSIEQQEMENWVRLFERKRKG